MKWGALHGDGGGDPWAPETGAPTDKLSNVCASPGGLKKDLYNKNPEQEVMNKSKTIKANQKIEKVEKLSNADGIKWKIPKPEPT